MLRDLLQVNAILGITFQATSDKVLTLRTDGRLAIEMHFRFDNLLVAVERNIAADHVVEKDSKRPHSCWQSLVPIVTYPLHRRIDAGT